MPAKLSLFGRVARWADRKLNTRGAKAIYGAASTGRVAEDWAAQILSADAEMRGALSTMRARARQLARDNAHAAGFVSAIVDGVLGPDGIGTRPRVRGASEELDDTTNGILWARHQEWCRREHCSADGQNSFVEMQRLILRTWAIDGEVLVRRGFGAPNAFGYDVQLIDADQLDETHNAPAAPGQNEIRMGVEVDARGKPVAYWIFSRHPADVNSRYVGKKDRVRVPADQIIHLFLQLRPGQTRGVPPLSPVMLTLKLVDEFTIATLMQARIAASAGGFFETDPTAYTPQENAPDGTPGRALELDLEPGVTRQLPPGLKFAPFDPAHPGDNFEAFTKVLLRMVARGAGHGLSYATLTGDLSETSYSSDRAGRLAERDAWRGIQHWFADRVLCPIYEDFVKFGLLSGALRLGSVDPTRWTAHDFEYRGWPWVDPLKDINAAGEELALRLTSRQRVCAERGRDFETILEELQEEDRLAAKYGVELEPAPSRDLTALQDAPTPPGKQPPGRALRLTGGSA